MQHTPVSPDLIAELAGPKSPGCRVSAYFPVDRPPADVRKNTIRVKNLLRDVKQALEDYAGVDTPQRTLDTIEEAGRGQCDWSHSFKGVGVFADASELRLVHLPIDPGEIVLASDGFYLKPLFEALQLEIPYLVLLLSLGQVRLARGGSGGLSMVENDDWLPSSLADVVGHRLSEPQLQHHSGTRGGDETIFHGQGSGKDDTGAEMDRFLRAVDDALCAHSSDATCVLLAGVDSLTSAFRRLSRYDALLPDSIPGNPYNTSLEQLFEKAWPRVRAFQQEQRDQALQRAKDQSPERQLTRIEDIVTAAADGRVEVLYVASDEECWGQYSPDERRIRLNDTREPGDEDLLNRAAVDSFVRGASVHTVPADTLPRGSVALATLRY